MRLATAGASALAVATAASSALAAGKPSVRFASLVTVSVRGAQFVPGESVRVTVVAGGARLARSVLASRTGAFTVSLGKLADKDRCSGSVAIVAVGKRGDRATYTLPAMSCTTASAGSVEK